MACRLTPDLQGETPAIHDVGRRRIVRAERGKRRTGGCSGGVRKEKCTSRRQCAIYARADMSQYPPPIPVGGSQTPARQVPPERKHFSLSEYCGSGRPDAAQAVSRLLKARAAVKSLRGVISASSTMRAGSSEQRVAWGTACRVAYTPPDMAARASRRGLWRRRPGTAPKLRDCRFGPHRLRESARTRHPSTARRRCQ
jgi:hypothetical protein